MELFFIPIRLIDLVEIVVVAYVLYQLYRLMRGTIAVQIFLGVAVLYLLDVLVSALNMTVLRSVFSTVGEVFVLAIIILFQPEIRRVLLVIGRNPLIRRFMKSTEHEKMVEAIVAAVRDMSRRRMGALIAFARVAGLRTYVETGTVLNAPVSRELLTQVFYPNTPLHDGAVVIVDRQIAAARCILPISQNKQLSADLGLRHRAAVGLTEQTDAFVVVVSEERGSISVADDGRLEFNLTEDEFRERLSEALSPARLSDLSLAPAADD